MTYGFIGAGVMGGAMIEGLINGGTDPSDIVACDKYLLKNITDAYCVHGADSVEALVGAADIVFVVVKPKDCREVFERVAACMNGVDKTVVSVVAGVTLANIEKMLEKKINVVRVMPNINARFNESATAVCPGPHTGAGAAEAICKCLKILGEVFMVDEEHFSVFTAIASCSPAFTYMYVDALSRAATRLGVNKKLAEKIAAQAVAGSAKALALSGKHPYEMVDAVCSPGGMTIEGVAELMESGFAPSVMRAVEACVNKDRALFGETAG